MCECPLPKWFRHKFVKDCKPMQVGANDEVLKQAAFVFIERHFKFCAPFETLSMTYSNIDRQGKNIGTYRISIELVEEAAEV